MKNLAIITFLLFLSHCGYTSIYKSQKSINFQINIIESQGDYEMNNLIQNEIKLYSNKDSKNIYNLKMETEYKKEILTKNSSGVITDYKLSVVTIFSIDTKNINKTFKYEENINIKSQNDTFEQNIYEKNIKSNFASSIRERLISEIVNLNDN